MAVDVALPPADFKYCTQIIFQLELSYSKGSTEGQKLQSAAQTDAILVIVQEFLSLLIT